MCDILVLIKLRVLQRAGWRWMELGTEFFNHWFNFSIEIFFLYKFHSFFGFGIPISWVVELLEKVLAFSLKQYLWYSHRYLAEEWLFFVFLIKKKSFLLRRTWAYIKELFSWMFSNFSIWGESVNRNSILMISKGYHYAINLVIVSNFYISIDPVYPGSLPKDLP